MTPPAASGGPHRRRSAVHPRMAGLSKHETASATIGRRLPHRQPRQRLLAVASWRGPPTLAMGETPGGSHPARPARVAGHGHRRMAALATPPTSVVGARDARPLEGLAWSPSASRVHPGGQPAGSSLRLGIELRGFRLAGGRVPRTCSVGDGRQALPSVATMSRSDVPSAGQERPSAAGETSRSRAGPAMCDALKRYSHCRSGSCPAEGADVSTGPQPHMEWSEGWTSRTTAGLVPSAIGPSSSATPPGRQRVDSHSSRPHTPSSMTTGRVRVRGDTGR